MSNFASPSDKSAWARRADHYFHVCKDFAHARQAYCNADLPYEAKVARAYLRRQQALRQSEAAGDKHARSKAYRDAADEFYTLAGEAPPLKQDTYFRIAAECFLQVPDDVSAAESYIMSHNPTQAILIYRRLGDFSQIVKVLHQHRTELENSVEAQARYAARLFYLKNRDFKCVHPHVETRMVLIRCFTSLLTTV